MRPEKKALLEKTYKHFFDVATNSISTKGVESILDEKLTGIGTTVDEIALSQDDFLNLLQSQKHVAKENSIEVETKMKRIRLDISSDENAAVVLEGGHFVLHIEGNQQIIPFRVSTFLVFTDNIWKVIHYHGSSPVMSEDDTYHLDEWKQKNAELEAEVKERTRELELRNRQAEVEVALERVRSRTMAMHKAEELIEVIEQIFIELQKLKFNALATDLLIFHPSKNHFDLWVSGVDGTEGPFDLPDINHQHHLDTIKAWKNGVDSRITKLSGESFKSYFESVFDPDLGLKTVPKKTKEKVFSLGEIYHSEAFTKHGCIRIASSHELSDHQVSIQKRFAQVFNQTYTRFLDLQKAEAQARQALIGAALERVRGMAMAMNHSDDINQIAEAIFNELGLLQVNPLRVGVGIIDGKNETIQTWTSTVDKDRTVNLSGNIPISVHPMLGTGFKAWSNNEARFIYKLAGKEKDSYYKNLSKTDYNLTDEENKDSDTPHFWCSVIFKTGALFFVIDHEPYESDLLLLERFGDVFQLAYTRFEDLNQAEEHTIDAIREASLDRVRAKIASMRNTEDLEQITPLIWKELTTLGVPFFRCGVFIMDEQTELIHTYLSKPDGEALAVLNLPYQSSELTINSIESWRNKEVYKETWDQDQFLEWVKTLADNDFIESEAIYTGSETPLESLSLHFFSFKQGMLYVGSAHLLDDNQIETAQDLASAFEVAYARYEDFKQLEEALHQLEATQDQLVQQEKLASLGQLTAGIAHEIKNPLNFVTNFSDLNLELLEEAKEIAGENTELIELLDDIEGNLRKIFEHGTRADRIVKSMLQHSRAGAGELQKVNFNGLVKEYVNLSFHGMRASKEPINVDLQFNLDPSVNDVSLLAEDFSRVIVNLCNNSFDAMREKVEEGSKDYKPTLSIKSSLDHGKVILEIEDNGLGIPEDIKDKVLQPFFTTKKGTDGTGLGLSITNDIIKAHGGTLEIESKEKYYTRFRVYLK